MLVVERERSWMAGWSISRREHCDAHDSFRDVVLVERVIRGKRELRGGIVADSCSAWPIDSDRWVNQLTGHIGPRYVDHEGLGYKFI